MAPTMMKPAFSTVACPEWTLSQVAERALANGFEAVELRTFGDNSTQFACDPALTSGDKVRAIFGDRGVEVLSLASGVRFDQMIFPPVLGYAISDTERSVREGRRAVDLAVAIECPYVRVFGFDFASREKRARAITRIAGRLAKVVDHAEKTGVKVVVENGGAFRSAADLKELLAVSESRLLGVCYNLAVGVAAGDTAESAIAALNDRLMVARIKDLKDGRPCELGAGEVGCEAFVRALAAAGFDGPLVYEWDRAWMPELAPAEQVLGPAAARIWSWLGGSIASPTNDGSPAARAGAPVGPGRRR
jgi:sugar phosphate isomerase/epimerase